jgi:tRNA G10  N-methylase Trm11
MQPYYEHAGITIYHGDCREVLPLINDGDVLVTDPPYGIQFASGMGGFLGACRVANDESTAVRDWVLGFWGSRPAVIFGSWKIARPPDVKALLIWDKGPHVGMGDLLMPWRPNHEEIYVLGTGFRGHRGSSILSYHAISPNFVKRDHPTEKPLALMLDLIVKCPVGIILDPFAGSGTTLVAAKETGRHAIGIELEERYCEIAATRLQQEVLPLEMATA